MVKLMFPGVAKRFEESLAYHEREYGIRPIFGLFWNLCINAPFLGQKRVHCRPHADAKNIVGVCALVVYQRPGAFPPPPLCVSDTKPTGTKFDSKRKTWLVLWEAGVVLELPPWVFIAYPSSLLYHFNIDIDGGGSVYSMLPGLTCVRLRYQVCHHPS